MPKLAIKLYFTPKMPDAAKPGYTIRVCPFNTPSGWLHAAVKYGVKHYRWLDRVFLWGDSLSGYGKKHNTDEFWGN